MHPTRYYDINMEESSQAGIADASGVMLRLFIIIARRVWRIFGALIMSKISNVNKFRMRNSNAVFGNETIPSRNSILFSRTYGLCGIALLTFPYAY